MRMFRFGSIALAAAILTPVAALANTDVHGDIDAVTIRLENATIDEAIKALEATYNVHFRAPGPMSKSISGSFQGSLKDVVKRVLNGYDFVLTTRGASVEVSVIGKSAAAAPATGTPTAGVPMAATQTATSVFKPSVTTQPKAPAAPKAQVAIVGTEKPVTLPVPDAIKTVEGTVPLMFAQADTSMPMPTPSNGGGSMPMPTPATSDNGLMPKPAASGATMPMPDTTNNASVQMPMPAGPLTPSSSQATPPAAAPKAN